MESNERVFYHELGHYVAHSLNKKLYGRMGITEFEIYPCQEDEAVWCGHVTPKKPDDFDENDPKKPPPLERLSFVLASIMYGCLFQAYYCKTDISHCYDKLGYSDLNKWISFLTAHKKGHLNSEIAAMEECYLKELLEVKALEDFMNINPNDYLIKTGQKSYSGDLAKLEKDLAELIGKHSKLYQAVVERYEQIIKKNLS